VEPPLAAAVVLAPEPARGAVLVPELVVVLVVVLVGVVVVLVGVDDAPAVVVFDIDVEVGDGAVAPPVPNGAMPVPESLPPLPQAETHKRPTNRNRLEIVIISAPHARARLCHGPLRTTMSVVVSRIHLRRQ
jgi:hypothetical protein